MRYDFTPHVEIASIDEGYFDLTSNRKKCPVEIAATIRKAIAQSLKISVSEGIASNKLVSQIASKLNKPACFLEVAPFGHEKEFPFSAGEPVAAGASGQNSPRYPQLRPGSPLAYNKIGGHARGFALPHCWKLRPATKAVRKRNRRKAGEVADKPRMQKATESNRRLSEDVTDDAFILATLRGMADRLMAKVREDRKSSRTVTLRVRYNDMDEVTRSISLDEPTDLENDIYPVLPGMLKRAWERRVSVRLVGLKLSNIYEGIFRCELPLE